MLKFDGRKKGEFRKKAQIVFQDPFSSLNPRMSVAQQIAEPLIINRIFAKKAEVDRKVMELMDTVGSPPGSRLPSPTSSTAGAGSASA